MSCCVIVVHDGVRHDTAHAELLDVLRQCCVNSVNHKRAAHLGIDPRNTKSGRLVTKLAQHAVSRPLHCRATDDWRYRHHIVAPRSEYLVDATQGTNRGDRYQWVRGCDDNPFGVL